jgi:ABC-2 type transport system permease protein
MASELYWLYDNTKVLTKRSITHIVRNLDQMLSIAVMPVMFLLLFRYVFGGAIVTGVSYVNFLIAGVLVQTLAFGANVTTFNIVLDMQRGIVDRFRSLPMADSVVLLSHVLADVVRNIASASIMLSVGFLVGFRPTASPTEWLLIFGLMILFSFAFSWFSAVLGLLVDNIEAAQWLGFVIIMPLTFTSSAFVPTESMPTGLRIFAENQPFTHLTDAMRAWMVGTPIGNSGWLSLIWCVGIIVVSIPLASWLYRHKTRK